MADLGQGAGLGAQPPAGQGLQAQRCKTGELGIGGQLCLRQSLYAVLCFSQISGRSPAMKCVLNIVEPQAQILGLKTQALCEAQEA